MEVIKLTYTYRNEAQDFTWFFWFKMEQC